MLVSSSRVPVPPGEGGAWRVSVDDGPPKDLYALWNSVFEAAHADGKTDEQRSRTESSGQAQVQPMGRAVVTTDGDLPMAVESDGAAHSSVASDSELMDSNSGRPDAPVAGTLETNTASQAAQRPPIPPTRFETTHTPLDGLPQPNESAPRCDLSVVMFDTQSPESAHVFVAGHLVEITVRAVTLCDREALDCAFETAHELTGQRSALQRLTVNGRTVYQHTDQVLRTPGSGSYYEA